MTNDEAIDHLRHDLATAMTEGGDAHDRRLLISIGRGLLAVYGGLPPSDIKEQLSQAYRDGHREGMRR